MTNLADGDKMAVRPAEVAATCFIDSAVPAETGVTDPSRYGGGDPVLDIFVDKS